MTALHNQTKKKKKGEKKIQTKRLFNKNDNTPCTTTNQNNKNDSQRRFMILSVGVLILSVAISWFVSTTTATTRDEEDILFHFLSHVPQYPTKQQQQQRLLEPHGRTHRATQDIPPNQFLFQIPRSIQLWDWDAYHYFSDTAYHRARHDGPSEQPLDGGAFLALYLWQQMQEYPEKDYFKVLPSANDTRPHHPLRWSNEEFQSWLPSQSHVHKVIRAYRDMVESEYQAFVQVVVKNNNESSSNNTAASFFEFPSWDEYTHVRSLVLSRSFGTGPPPTSFEKEQQNEIETRFGISNINERCCRAMVPILDMYNHDPDEYNVIWKYSWSQQAFLIASSSKGISKGALIQDSYGTYTEPHLLGKFGFTLNNNHRRRMATEVSLAVFPNHHLQVLPQHQYVYTTTADKEGEIALQQVMARYLQFDDGYDRCLSILSSKSSSSIRLKQLKFQHLLRMADITKRWIITVMPSSSSSAEPKFDASQVLSTCRLLSLREDDFDGQALQRLLNETNDAIVIEKQSPALEYRSLACLARWTGFTLSKFPKQQDTKTNSNNNKDTSWVLQGEQDTLQWVYQMARAGLQTYQAQEEPPLRNKPCPWHYTREVLFAE